MGKLNEPSGAQKRKKRKSQREKSKAEESKLQKISSLFKRVGATAAGDEENLRGHEKMDVQSHESSQSTSETEVPSMSEVDAHPTSLSSQVDALDFSSTHEGWFTWLSTYPSFMIHSIH